MKVTTRPATAADAEFAWRCEEEAMKPYALATWGEWPAERVRARAYEKAASGRTGILELRGEPVGVLRVERSDACLRLQAIYLTAGHRRRGIGTAVIRDLIDEATAAGVPVRLRVLRVNPARHLYRRLGFAVVETTEEYEDHEHPGGRDASTRTPHEEETC